VQIKIIIKDEHIHLWEGIVQPLASHLPLHLEGVLCGIVIVELCQGSLASRRYLASGCCRRSCSKNNQPGDVTSFAKKLE